ncbi:excinuclease ABC subunit UvrA [candidate division WOR-3 bacterium]|nr:excinuclease ABC subunit UvrA [candidate division WOR-3 bacterium]
MEKKFIALRGIRVHNLKNIDVTIPRGKLVVITGVSGSGKSSLAFDTIYAEGQRRYIESLSAYARQFLGMMEKPDVDYIEGLSPAIAIQQRTISRNPRSTVGTITEIHDYLRLLFTHIGIPHCPKCGRNITAQSHDEILESIMTIPEGTRIMILAPVVKDKKGEFKAFLKKLQSKGYVRTRVDDIIYSLDNRIEIDPKKHHNIEIIIDRLIMKDSIKRRLSDSLNIALNESGGTVIIYTPQDKRDEFFSEHFACPYCNINLGEITPKTFSFNSPYGACPTCNGLGTEMVLDIDLVVDMDRSIPEGAIIPFANSNKNMLTLRRLAKRYEVNINTQFKKLPDDFKNAVLYGDNIYVGVADYLVRKYNTIDSDWLRYEIEKYMVIKPCSACNGKRLKCESLAITVNKLSVADISEIPINESLAFFKNKIKLTDKEKAISKQILNEIIKRLSFLNNVGLSYLTLSRRTDSLSGGEEQRVRLATQIGSGLTGVLYILDEPSIGLHQRDNKMLLNTLLHLRDLGNTVIVVEHDKETIRTADHILDLGPGAGHFGGEVVGQGTVEDLINSKKSLTGEYLSGKRKIKKPKKRRNGINKQLTIIGANENNLKNIDVSFPLGTLICITGVSGSGKSSLIFDILFNALKRYFYFSRTVVGKHNEIRGAKYIDKVISIDQNPIGRTSRSNPITYTGGFTPIRELFASTKEAKIRGYSLSRFSFNVKGGRCEACTGEGLIKKEMHFLPDIYVICDVCKGKRYNKDTLEVKYKEKNIYNVLDMTVKEAQKFFEDIPRINKKLQLLVDVGLGYIKLGQPAPTLSGGEAQRIKLAKELSKVATGNTLYLLDEPTTGLHFEDINMLLSVLDRLVDKGNTVVVIEHNLDVIKSADYVIDLGPYGGKEGGYIVAKGTPEEIVKTKKSFTGQYLKSVL